MYVNMVVRCSGNCLSFQILRAGGRQIARVQKFGASLSNLARLLPKNKLQQSSCEVNFYLKTKTETKTQVYEINKTFLMKSQTLKPRRQSHQVTSSWRDLYLL